ncbi:D-alanyl-D-alanine carboxypeptidase [Polaribacter glomeratus]|uniref:D-alanyl-D-alanine carboxypeptidase n=1 Tax=Polaribacter glomeratus TaxID=102 RepID=A0A2S7WGL8_9FLAO|nr:D-alanyl-D-alanine carboxypeptidase [Polaribacter glomeratus]PQJ76763.1 D-alanyl-D-alanine carboxypeptidase [Polaribacter glomeratus]TXD67395.1 D-alanyl-D-alanine carboxypeptidase [Polaribacter glomeratus]
MFKKIFYLLCCTVVFIGCKSLRIKHKINKEIASSFFENQFTGIYIYDVNAAKVVYNYNGSKYFTPASNTKIFTLYTGLELLSDSIPAFKYAVDKDTITIQGTGDPTFLHSFFKDSTALKMAKNYKKVNLIVNTITDKKFAAGWAWEDFDSYFSPERSAFPMYGNVVTIQNENELIVTPLFFENELKITDKNYGREELVNNFYFGKNRTRETAIPMIIDTILLTNLWNDILPNKVKLIKESAIKPFKIAYSIPSDTLYKRMMEVSDNFLAEQLLIMASSTLSDTLNSKKAIDFIIANQLKDLKQKPRWVDGSGLSRYNLFTPISFVDVLIRMYKEIQKERLFLFFPVGNAIQNLKDKRFIYAKSGTLGNNYSLSGYLITNSNKILVFSFMNNHFMHTNAEVKEQMQFIFEQLRDQY